MKKAFARFIIKIIGWTYDKNIPTEKKYVMVVAPHTSAIEMFMGKLFGWAAGFRPSIIVKKEFFYFPVGFILRKWGGVPIDRQNPVNIVRQIADEFEKRDEMILAITPEGTRKPNPNWKTGFYRIAQMANVPIYLACADFKKKKLQILGEFKPSGNLEKDMELIKQEFKDVTAYRPENFAI